MSDERQPPPRVDAMLPGGQPVASRLDEWRLVDGQWWAQITVRIPAAAVRPVAGEDYTAVPRIRPAGEPKYVIVAPILAPGAPLSAEVHTADCWAIPRGSSNHRITEMSGAQARSMIRFDDTTPCRACLRPDWTPPAT